MGLVLIAGRWAPDKSAAFFVSSKSGVYGVGKILKRKPRQAILGNPGAAGEPSRGPTNNTSSNDERKAAPRQGRSTTMQRSLGKMLVGNMLATAAIRFSDCPAIYCTSTDRRFSFREVNDRANRLAQALFGAGTRKGDVVAFLPSTRAEIVEIYSALARTGVIGLPLNYRLAATEMLE